MRAVHTVKKKAKVTKRKISKKEFTVVAIGASAGGLEAIKVLFQNLPADTGMAYIYVQHLSPDHKSFLTSILSRITKMKVQEIDDMQLMKPNNVYVIPANKGIEVTDGHIKIIPRSKNSVAISIDILFKSLAETHKANVIGIILSGNASDGTFGLKAIKNAGGLTFAQDHSAEFSSMPKSAIAAGVVDIVMSPKGIARELARIAKSSLLKAKYLHRRKNEKEAEIAEDMIENNDPDLQTVLEILHKNVNVDFSRYKMATIKRRLRHRMLQCNLHDVKKYAKLLLKKNDEVENLYKDLLINVTSFFRDPETFRYLKSTFLPKLLKEKTDADPLRIWIPACSSGEETYSIAMLITELQDSKKLKIPIQIFATDLSDTAIRDARIGEYSKGDVSHLPQKYVKRFFTRIGENFRIDKGLREMCVFAPHNILRDPPFFKIDMISCCNLLIYFDATAQKKALETFHFSLKEGGYLMLGKSETTGTSSQLYTQVNEKFKIYCRKKNSGMRKVPELSPRFAGTELHTKKLKPLAVPGKQVKANEIDTAVDALLLSRYMPACAIVNKELEILQFRGNSSLYLSHPSGGKASLNILKMTRPEFAFELRNAIHKAIKTKKPVRKSAIEMKIGSSMQLVSLEVCPLRIEWDEPLLLIIFTTEQVEKFADNPKNVQVKSPEKDRRIKKLMEELTNVRSEMHYIIESQETSYEELQAANEEIVSTNEEFQTLNEELETSKEEIQASNEELISTNQELQLRNEMLTESYNYSEAIIATIHEPMIVLNEKLDVKSASKSFYKKFNTTKEATEGYSIFELGNQQWDIPELRALLSDVRTKNLNFDDFEVTHVFPGIGERVMLLNAHRILQRNHKEQLILLAIDDITERSRHYQKEKELLNKDIRSHKEEKQELEIAVKRRTRQLQQKNKELESANKDLTSFTYISSHDLQEPLRKIQNFAAVIQLEEGKNLSKSGKSYFERMNKTAKRMQRLIEDLLAYSRTKNSDRIFEETSLNSLVDDVLGDYEEVLHERGATVQVGSLGSASVIPFQFRQLIQNLISNSLKFAIPSVPLRISIKGKIVEGEESGIKDLYAKTKYIHIAFRDNGIGFDPQYNERIFQVFQRLHSSEKYTGTGIGLAICQRIVENHHGAITASGRINKGARFDIYIPVE